MSRPRVAWRAGLVPPVSSAPGLLCREAEAVTGTCCGLHRDRCTSQPAPWNSPWRPFPVFDTENPCSCWSDVRASACSTRCDFSVSVSPQTRRERDTVSPAAVSPGSQQEGGGVSAGSGALSRDASPPARPPHLGSGSVRGDLHWPPHCLLPDGGSVRRPGVTLSASPCLPQGGRPEQVGEGNARVPFPPSVDGIFTQCTRRACRRSACGLVLATSRNGRVPLSTRSGGIHGNRLTVRREHAYGADTARERWTRGAVHTREGSACSTGGGARGKSRF